MYNHFRFVFSVLLLTSLALQAQYTATWLITGKVTDFNGNPVDSALVELKKRDFTTATNTYSGKDGTYKLAADEGKYMLMTCIRPGEFPAGSNLNAADQRLRFMAWNIILSGNLEIDIRYNRLEIYGVNIFRVPGGVPGYMIYCRPMSLTRAQQSDNDLDLTPGPDELDIQVEINGHPVKVNKIQRIEEYTGKDSYLYAYLLQVGAPTQTARNNDIFRILMKDKINGDTGEAIYFKEKDGYW